MTDDLVSQVCKTEDGARMFERELLAVTLAEEICKAMEGAGIDRDELAKRMGVPHRVVTAILDGSVQPGSLIADIFTAMGRRLVVRTEAIS